MRGVPAAAWLLLAILVPLCAAAPAKGAEPAVCIPVDARPEGDGSVTLRWTPSPGAAWYRIHRAEIGGEGRDIGRVAAPTTSFRDTATAPGTTYRYTVLADPAPGQPGAACPGVEATAIAYGPGLVTALTVAGVAALGYLLVAGTRRAPVARR